MHNATARFGRIDLPERSPRDGLTTVITEEVAYLHPVQSGAGENARPQARTGQTAQETRQMVPCRVV